jgi:hypothetical protein
MATDFLKAAILQSIDPACANDYNSERKQELLQSRQFCSNYFPLQSLLAPVGAVLRGADEHLDEIIMQRVEELTLETPFELRVIEIARMQVEKISVHRNRFIFELYDDFYAVAFRTRVEVQERKLSKDAVEAGIVCVDHRGIVAEDDSIERRRDESAASTALGNAA